MTRPKHICQIGSTPFYSTTAAAREAGCSPARFVKMARANGFGPVGWVRWVGPPFADLWGEAAIGHVRDLIAATK